MMLAAAGVLAVRLGERALDREHSPRRAFGIVFLRHRKARSCHRLEGAARRSVCGAMAGRQLRRSSRCGFSLTNLFQR